ncbi:endophilin-A3-like [Diretmus argenteus]
MSVSGMKKQFHKASQLLHERLMGAEGTRLDEDFLKMEKSVDVIQTLLVELLSRTTEFLHPNPAYRAKLSMLSTVSRIRGQEKTTGYPQTEGMLGDCMSHYGQELGAASGFGGALANMGDALQEVGQARDTLDINVKRTFIDPLQELHNKELKEIRYQLKKLQGHRLDFDYKKRRRGKVPEEEIQLAWDKFVISKDLTERSMFTLLENDVDQVRCLSALIAAVLDFHRHAHHILLGLHSNLQARLTAASNTPDQQAQFKVIQTRTDNNSTKGFYHQLSFASTTSSGEQTTVLPSRPESPIVCNADSEVVLDQPCCRAIYSFHSENEGELSFNEGDVIILTNQIDANWYEGELSGQSGFIPISYVDVLVPLPLP